MRRLTGAANIDGGPLFHVISGNLGYQVEHHLFPDMPSTRYGEIATKVTEMCQRYGLPYNSGPFHSSSGWCSERSPGSGFPVASTDRSPAPTTVRWSAAKAERVAASIGG